MQIIVVCSNVFKRLIDSVKPLNFVDALNFPRLDL